MNQGKVATHFLAQYDGDEHVSIPYESGKSGHALLVKSKLRPKVYQSLMNQGKVATSAFLRVSVVSSFPTTF